MGDIKYKSYRNDLVDYRGDPLKLIKEKWEEFELGSIYLARIYVSSMYLALIQKYSSHAYGSVVIFSYEKANPIYARLNNNVWSEQTLITNSDFFFVSISNQVSNGVIRYNNEKITLSTICVVSLGYNGGSANYNYSLIAQPGNGYVSVYVKNPDNTPVSDGTTVNLHLIFGRP